MTAIRSIDLPRRLRAAVACALALLASCGGVGTGGTGGDAAGPITGFGSVIVSGVEFEDGDAVVLDDDGNPLPRVGGELKLGTVVRIEATPIFNGFAGLTSTARTIRIATALIGPAAAIDVPGGRFSVLGERVDVDAGTVFDAAFPGGLSGLRPGDRVAVHALPEPVDGRYVATRVEPAPLAASARVRGAVSALDPAARTFRIGATTFDYSGASGVPADLANGRRVHLRLAGEGAGTLTVASFGRRDEIEDEGHQFEIEGLVDAFTDARSFSVDGRAVDAGSAAFEPSPSALAAGARVAVGGRVAGGRLVAERVKVFGGAEIGARVYSLAGVVKAVDAAAQIAVVRDTRVDFAAAEFVNGSASMLVPGAAVRAEGRLSADGSRIVATRVTIR